MFVLFYILNFFIALPIPITTRFWKHCEKELWLVVQKYYSTLGSLHRFFFCLCVFVCICLFVVAFISIFFLKLWFDILILGFWCCFFILSVHWKCFLFDFNVFFFMFSSICVLYNEKGAWLYIYIYMFVAGLQIKDYLQLSFNCMLNMIALDNKQTAEKKSMVLMKKDCEKRIVVVVVCTLTKEELPLLPLLLSIK